MQILQQNSTSNHQTYEKQEIASVNQQTISQPKCEMTDLSDMEFHDQLYDLLDKIEKVQQKQRLIWAEEDMKIDKLFRTANMLHAAYGKVCWTNERVKELKRLIKKYNYYSSEDKTVLQTKIATDLELDVFIVEYKISELDDQNRVTQQKNSSSRKNQTIKKGKK
ncbi:Hypothetical_protein [Hexamita inflata]|uniref:Hypothetical_protein n=1 Tax=Hexamita inflata TaxID=28002 RepID=A0AA86UW20_9EUKA|nr:Hypothetical protein HINF_LOCUS54646 [Hexamita inflata]